MYLDSTVVFSSDMYFTLKLIKAGAEPLSGGEGESVPIFEESDKAVSALGDAEPSPETLDVGPS